MTDYKPADAYGSWSLLQRGDSTGALKLFSKQRLTGPTLAGIFQLGVALLWTEGYTNAALQLRAGIEEEKSRRRSSDELFALLGAAEWCLKDYCGAVKSWKLGVKATGSIGGGRTHCPLLLLLASILRPDQLQRATAEEVLFARLSRLNPEAWPGTVARYAAGLIDAEALERSWPVTPPLNRRLLGPSAEWLRDFYTIMRNSTRGTVSPEGRRNEMRALVERFDHESCELADFIDIVRLPELYIAKHEASLS